MEKRIENYIKKDDVKSIVKDIVAGANMSLDEKSFTLKCYEDFEGDNVLRVRFSLNQDKKILKSGKLANMTADIREKIYNEYKDVPEKFFVLLYPRMHAKQEFKWDNKVGAAK